MFIYAHNPASEGAKSLANTLGIRRIRHKNSKFSGDLNKTVINWGSSDTPPEVNKCNVYNRPSSISIAINKLRFFEVCKEADVRVPDFSSKIEDALQWVKDGRTAVCRTVLRGMGGKGIVMADNANQVVKAPLYTAYVKKKKEFRIHCTSIGGKDTIFDAQEKAKKHEVEHVDYRIRNLENGFVFKRKDIDVPDDVNKQALAAFKASGLDFGAVDVIWNDAEEQAYVLEANTAPGLEGQTLQSYAKIFS